MREILETFFRVVGLSKKSYCFAVIYGKVSMSGDTSM